MDVGLIATITIITLILAAITYNDLKYTIIPDFLIMLLYFAMFPFGLSFSTYFSLLFLSIFVLFTMFFLYKHELIGGGDVKLILVFVLTGHVLVAILSCLSATIFAKLTNTTQIRLSPFFMSTYLAYILIFGNYRPLLFF